VTARALPGQPGVVVIDSIEGDGGRLPLVADKNCVGIAVLETIKLLPSPPACGVSLSLLKVCLS
jgi:homoserine kinase